MLSTDQANDTRPSEAILVTLPCRPPSVAEDPSHCSDNFLFVLPIPVDQIEDHFHNSFAQNLLKIDL